MKRISLWVMSTLTVLVLLFGYHTSTSSRAAAGPDSSAVAPISGGSTTTTNGSTGASGTAGGSSSPGGSDSVSPSRPSPGTSAPSTSSAATASPTTVTGSVAATRWGPVQVQLTVADGQISDVSVVQYPHENGKDQQINARAIPVLINETLAAQTADIDMVSGATITSEGYISSLQSAIDQAGL